MRIDLHQKGGGAEGGIFEISCAVLNGPFEAGIARQVSTEIPP